MIIVCSWCQTVIGEKEPFKDPSTIHGKCLECIRKDEKNDKNLPPLSRVILEDPCDPCSVPYSLDSALAHFVFWNFLMKLTVTIELIMDARRGIVGVNINGNVIPPTARWVLNNMDIEKCKKLRNEKQTDKTFLTNSRIINAVVHLLILGKKQYFTRRLSIEMQKGAIASIKINDEPIEATEKALFKKDREDEKKQQERPRQAD